MTAPVVKGWCPGAYRPMMSGDGLIVRIRPRLGRLEAFDIHAICKLADIYGNGVIELTNRANLQLRGVREESHESLLEELNDLGLLDQTPELESRRNILIEPFWQAGDLTCSLAHQLTERLGDLPRLPAKFGFAIDTGPKPVLTKSSADIRIETSMDGQLILRADGIDTGFAVTKDDVIDHLINLAQWFADQAGDGTTRMKQLLQTMPIPSKWIGAQPATAANQPKPQSTPLGPLVGVPFGQIEAKTFAAVSKDISAVRTTPWRLLLLEGASDLKNDAFIVNANDPLLRVDACPGMPCCASAQIETRDLARSLAGRITGNLHVSGCEKGCARTRPADITLVGRNGKFDIIRNGTAQDMPDQTRLLPANICKVIN